MGDIHPAGEDAYGNLYTYVYDDPIDLSDRNGLSADSEGDCFLCNIFGEAGSTSQACQYAVASVLMNNVAEDRAHGCVTTVCDVAARRFDAAKNGGNNAYKYCMRCRGNQPPSQLSRHWQQFEKNFSHGVPKTTDAQYYSNATAAMDRKRLAQGATRVPNKQCGSFHFWTMENRHRCPIF